MATEAIFHLTDRATWDLARAAGTYTGSTRGAGLDEVGFVHCSFADQVEPVADFVYPDWTEDLLLLEIDVGRLAAEVRVENLDGGTEKFPHIYGPIDVQAVVAVRQLVRTDEGWQSS